MSNFTNIKAIGGSFTAALVASIVKRYQNTDCCDEIPTYEEIMRTLTNDEAAMLKTIDFFVNIGLEECHKIVVNREPNASYNGRNPK